MKFDLSLTVDDEVIDEFIARVMDNCPECSISMRCTKWDYENGEFHFLDVEEWAPYNKTKHKIKLKTEEGARQAREAFQTLIFKALKGDFNVYGWDVGPFFSYCLTKDRKRFEDWLCDWDAEVTDGLIQCFFFKDVIYG